MLSLEFRTKLVDHPFPYGANDYYQPGGLYPVPLRFKKGGERPFFMSNIPDEYSMGELKYSQYSPFQNGSINMNRAKEVLTYSPTAHLVKMGPDYFYLAKGFLAITNRGNASRTTEQIKILFTVNSIPGKTYKDTSEMPMYLSRALYDPSLKRVLSILKEVVSDHTGDLFIVKDVDSRMVYTLETPKFLVPADKVKFEENMKVLFVRSLREGLRKREEAEEKARQQIAEQARIQRERRDQQIRDRAERDERQRLINEQARIEGERIRAEQQRIHDERVRQMRDPLNNINLVDDTVPSNINQPASPSLDQLADVHMQNLEQGRRIMEDANQAIADAEQAMEHYRNVPLHEVPLVTIPHEPITLDSMRAALDQLEQNQARDQQARDEEIARIVRTFPIRMDVSGLTEGTVEEWEREARSRGIQFADASQYGNGDVRITGAGFNEDLITALNPYVMDGRVTVMVNGSLITANFRGHDDAYMFFSIHRNFIPTVSGNFQYDDNGVNQFRILSLLPVPDAPSDFIFNTIIVQSNDLEQSVPGLDGTTFQSVFGEATLITPPEDVAESIRSVGREVHQLESAQALLDFFEVRSSLHPTINARIMLNDDLVLSRPVQLSPGRIGIRTDAGTHIYEASRLSAYHLTVIHHGEDELIEPSAPHDFVPSPGDVTFTLNAEEFAARQPPIIPQPTQTGRWVSINTSNGEPIVPRPRQRGIRPLRRGSQEEVHPFDARQPVPPVEQPVEPLPSGATRISADEIMSLMNNFNLATPSPETNQAEVVPPPRQYRYTQSYNPVTSEATDEVREASGLIDRTLNVGAIIQAQTAMVGMYLPDLLVDAWRMQLPDAAIVATLINAQLHNSIEDLHRAVANEVRRRVIIIFTGDRTDHLQHIAELIHSISRNTNIPIHSHSVVEIMEMIEGGSFGTNNAHDDVSDDGEDAREDGGTTVRPLAEGEQPYSDEVNNEYPDECEADEFGIHTYYDEDGENPRYYYNGRRITESERIDLISDEE